MRSFLFFTLLIAGGLYFTKPTDAEFKAYTENYISKRILGHEEVSGVKKVLGKIATKISSELTEELTSKKDYIFFTLYEVKLDKQEPYKFVGIAGNFLPLQTTEPFKD